MTFLLGALAALTILPSVSTVSSASSVGVDSNTVLKSSSAPSPNKFPVLNATNITQNFRSDLNNAFEAAVKNGSITNVPNNIDYQLHIDRVLQVPDHQYLYLVLTSVWENMGNTKNPSYILIPAHQLDMWGYDTNATSDKGPIFKLLNQVTNDVPNQKINESYFENIQKTSFQIIKTAKYNDYDDTYGLTFNYRPMTAPKTGSPTDLKFPVFFSVSNDQFKKTPALTISSGKATASSFYFSGNLGDDTADKNSFSSIYIGSINKNPALYFWVNKYSKDSDGLTGQYYTIYGNYDGKSTEFASLTPKSDIKKQNPGSLYPNTQSLSHYQAHPGATTAIQNDQNIYTISHDNSGTGDYFEYANILLPNNDNPSNVNIKHITPAAKWHAKGSPISNSGDYWSSQLVTNSASSSNGSNYNHQILFFYNSSRYKESFRENYLYVVSTVNNKYGSVAITKKGKTTGAETNDDGVWDANPANLHTSLKSGNNTLSLLLSNKIFDVSYDATKDNKPNVNPKKTKTLPLSFDKDLSNSVLAFYKENSNLTGKDHETYYLTYNDTKDKDYKSVQLNYNSKLKTFNVQQLASSTHKLFGTLINVPTVTNKVGNETSKSSSILAHQYYLTYNLSPITFDMSLKTQYSSYYLSDSILDTALINPVVTWNNKHKNDTFNIKWEFGTKPFNYNPSSTVPEEQLIDVLNDFFTHFYNDSNPQKADFDNNPKNISKLIKDYTPIKTTEKYIRDLSKLTQKQKSFITDSNIDKFYALFENEIINDKNLINTIKDAINKALGDKSVTINIKPSDTYLLNQISTYNINNNPIDLLFVLNQNKDSWISSAYNDFRTNIWKSDPTGLGLQLPKLENTSKYKSYANELSGNSVNSNSNPSLVVKFDDWNSDNYDVNNIINAANMANFVAYFRDHMVNVDTKGTTLNQIISNLSKYDSNFKTTDKIVTSKNNDLNLNSEVIESSTPQNKYTTESAKEFTNSVIKYFEPIPNKPSKSDTTLILEIVIPIAAALLIIVALIWILVAKKKRSTKTALLNSKVVNNSKNDLGVSEIQKSKGDSSEPDDSIVD